MPNEEEQPLAVREQDDDAETPAPQAASDAEAAAETPEPLAEPDLKARLLEAIDVQLADAGVLRKTLTVTVPADFVHAEREKQFEELIGDVVVPGFRKGRAPRTLVEKRYGGEVSEQVLTKLASNAYMAATEKLELKILGDPVFRVKIKEKQRTDGRTEEVERDRLIGFQDALEHMKLPPEGEPLAFVCELEVKPEFELPKLDGIPVTRPKVTITDRDVEIEVKRQLSLASEWRPLAEGVVEPNDLVVADLKITVGDKTVKEQENVTLAARPQSVEGAELRDLGEKLTGAQSGDSRTLTAKLPDDYSAEEFRGAEATFELKIHEIKRLQLPPLDEAFLSPRGFESEQEFREFIRQRLEAQLSNAIRDGMRGQVYRYLLDQTKLDLPEGMSQRQIDRAVARRIAELRQRGVPQAEIDAHADELRTSARDKALTDLKLYFILEQIAEQLELDVSEEEFNGAVAEMARGYGLRFDRMRDILLKQGGLESVYLQIRDNKCIDALLAKADVTESEGPAQPASELADAT